MPHLIGIQAADLDAARAFYTEVVGLAASPNGPPDAVVFDTRPIPFAVRTPLVDLDAADALGHGVALWFGCDDVDACTSIWPRATCRSPSRRRTDRSVVTSRSAIRSATRSRPIRRGRRIEP